MGDKTKYICQDCNVTEEIEDCGEDWLFEHWGHDIMVSTKFDKPFRVITKGGKRTEDISEYARKRHDAFKPLCEKIADDTCDRIFSSFKEELSHLLFCHLAPCATELIDDFRVSTKRREAKN